MTKQTEALKLALEALEETLRTLDDENAKPGGAIADTIWYSPYETLFDYLDAQIATIREALAEQPAQQRLELIGHADLSIMNIHVFSEYGDTEIPERRVPLYAGYKK